MKKIKTGTLSDKASPSSQNIVYTVPVKSLDIPNSPFLKNCVHTYDCYSTANRP